MLMAGSLQLTGKNARLARGMLRDVVEILESENIPYTLEGGTLLGIIREGRLLPWDNDLDLTITRPYCPRLLSIRWKFWLRGYRTRIRKSKKDTWYSKKGSPRILKIQTTKFIFLKGVSLMDIFIKDLVGERYYWTVSEKTVLKSVPRPFYEKLTKLIFEGKFYNIPEDYDTYLKLRYGEWQIPKRNWDFTKDDLSIEQVMLATKNK